LEDKQNNQGVIHIAHAELDPTKDFNTTDNLNENVILTVEEHNHAQTKRIVNEKNYGRNYFGYQSCPGSKKRVVKKKNTKEDQTKVTENYIKAGEQIMQRKQKKTLRTQQQANMSIQERVNCWKKDTSAPSRKKLWELSQSPGVEHANYLRDQLSKIEGEEDEDGEHDENREKREKKAKKERRLPPLYPLKNGVTRNDIFNNPIYHNTPPSSADDVTKNGESTQPKLELNPDVVFDANIYAPDGRVRMKHRLPEFNKSFEVAKNTRYIRTKQKRDFEEILSASQIFNDD